MLTTVNFIATLSNEILYIEATIKNTQHNLHRKSCFICDPHLADFKNDKKQNKTTKIQK